MGLLTIIRKNRRKEKEMRLLFLGLDNAGKTTILKKLNDEDITGVSPTLGFNIKTFVHGRYTLNIWDVGGQRTLRPYWRNYFEQTDALVWVVDSGDRLRLGDCKEELHSLLLEDRLAGASLLVFANKQDIQGSMTDKEIEQALDLPAIKSHQWSIVPCSAITGYNLLEGLNWVVGEVAGRLYYSTFTEGVAGPVLDKPPVLFQPNLAKWLCVNYTEAPTLVSNTLHHVLYRLDRGIFVVAMSPDIGVLSELQPFYFRNVPVILLLLCHVCGFPAIVMKRLFLKGVYFYISY